MKRLILSLCTLLLLSTQALAQVHPPIPRTKPIVESEGPLRFAILSDRHGGMRPGVFPQGIREVNMLRPEFVMCVGDLLGNGAATDATELGAIHHSFKSEIKELQAPFFYTVGNHDIGNLEQEAAFYQHAGAPYYAFKHKDALFVVLCTQYILNPGEQFEGRAEAQLNYVKKFCKDVDDVKWTFVFMHHPIWKKNYEGPAREQWTAITEALGDRDYTVFGGHIHTYTYEEIDGRKHITLATTGGSSSLSGRKDGRLDHFTWVTFDGNEPTIANIELGAVFDDKNDGE